MVELNAPGSHAVVVEDLVRHFGGVAAVAGISFRVRNGEIFGFLGPNGAGKTTTMRILATLDRPSSGRAEVASYDVVTQSQEVRRSIGMVFQDPTLDLRLTAAENLSFHGMVYGLRGAHLRERMDAVLEMVELAGRRRDLVATFSGGMKRRLEIARGLLHSPQVLFLDEPTVGLDPQTRRTIWKHICTLPDTDGTTVFMTTHYLDEAEFCDRIAIIDHGQIVAMGTPEELKRAVGGDVVTLDSDDPDGLAEVVCKEFQLPCRRSHTGLALDVPDGGILLASLLPLLAGRVHSVGLHRPTLDDAFMHFTGHEIRDEPLDYLAVARSTMRRQ